MPENVMSILIANLALRNGAWPNCPPSCESVEKLGAERILFVVTILCRAVGMAGRNTADDGTAETDRVLILLFPFGRADS
jgi:hypothetical protein